MPRTLPPASRSSALPAQALYGRDDAETLVLEVYRQAVVNNLPGIVFITGEGGLGKTRFLIEAESKLYEINNGVTVAYGRALAQYSESNGYQPIREALADLVFEAQRKERHSLLKRIARVARDTAPDWLAAVPAVGSLLQAASKTVLRTMADYKQQQLENSLTRQFCDLVQEIINDSPLVLCLDDLHWADASTVDLVYSLTQSIRSGPFVLVCAFREADLQLADGMTHPLLETSYRIERYCNVTRIELTHLNAGQVGKLVEDTIGRPPPVNLISTLMKLTSGNPLFVHEYLGLLIDKLGPQASPATLARSLSLINSSGPPRRVESVIEERLTRLSDEEVRTLEVAALLGPVFAPDDLMAVLDIDSQNARTALRSLCRRHALINAVPLPNGPANYAFHHATVAQVLEARLKRIDPYDYQEMHRCIAAHLEQARELDLALLERLAHHALASGDIDVALKAAVDAARAAWKIGALKESWRLLKSVTEPFNKPWRDQSIVLEAATLRLLAANAVADHEDAVQFGAVLISDPIFGKQLSAKARLAVARAFRMTNNWHEARKIVKEIAEGGPGVTLGSQAEALLLLGQIELCGTPARVKTAIEVLQQAQELSPEPEIMYQIVGHIGLSKLVLHDVDDSFRSLETAVGYAQETGNPLDHYEALHWRSKAEIACLRLAPAMRTLDELEFLSDRTGVASAVPFHIRDRARVLALEGRFSSSAAAYCRYLETVSQLSSPMQFRRGLAILACQCLELADLNRPQDARTLASSLIEPLAESWLDEDQRVLITRTLEFAAMTTSLDLLSTRMAEIGLLARNEFQAVDAVYRFDIGNLHEFRQKLARR